MAASLAAGHAVTSRNLSKLARRLPAFHPELWLYALAAGAAVTLLLQGPHAHNHQLEDHHHMHSMPSSDPGMEATGQSWLGVSAGWTLMVLAMMLPVAAPLARRVAMRSLWRRRHRMMTCFVLGYLATWVVVGAVITGFFALTGAPQGALATSIALVAAAVWQISRARRRTMRRCGALAVVALRGPRAYVDNTCVGCRSGLGCAYTCGPVMIAMTIGHSLVLMAGLFALLLTERARGPNPERRAGRPLEAWCLLGTATLVLTSAIA